MSELSYKDTNGVDLRVGDMVWTGTYGRFGEVVILEGPIPGSRSTSQGYGTVYVRFTEDPPGPLGTHHAFEARRVTRYPRSYFNPKEIA